MKNVYPTILTPVDMGYVVSIPDLHINTEGTDLANAIEMARDAIGLWGICEEDVGRSIPSPATFNPICKNNEIVTLVDIDLNDYRRARAGNINRIQLTTDEVVQVLDAFKIPINELHSECAYSEEDPQKWEGG